LEQAHTRAESKADSLRRLLNAATPEGRATAQEKYDYAVGVRDALGTQAQQAHAAYNKAQTNLDTANKDMKEEASPLNALLNDQNKKRDSQKALDKAFPQQLFNFIDTVKTAPIDQTIYEVDAKDNRSCLPSSERNSDNCREGLISHARQYTMTTRLRVLDDLATGEPSRWPEITDIAVKKDIADQFPLYNVCDSEQNGCRGTSSQERSEAEKKHRDKDAHKYTHRIWGVFFLAMLIPLVTIIMKFTMRPELTYYYSTLYQATRMHPEARAFNQIFRIMHRDKDKKKDKDDDDGGDDEPPRDKRQ
jgi:hypothetical protein